MDTTLSLEGVVSYLSIRNGCTPSPSPPPCNQQPRKKYRIVEVGVGQNCRSEQNVHENCPSAGKKSHPTGDRSKIQGREDGAKEHQPNDEPHPLPNCFEGSGPNRVSELFRSCFGAPSKPKQKWSKTCCTENTGVIANSRNLRDW